MHKHGRISYVRGAFPCRTERLIELFSLFSVNLRAAADRRRRVPLIGTQSVTAGTGHSRSRMRRVQYMFVFCVATLARVIKHSPFAGRAIEQIGIGNRREREMPWKIVRSVCVCVCKIFARKTNQSTAVTFLLLFLGIL